MKARSSPRAHAKKGVTPDMNVTPLVDVVLVLLIIFMVIAPITTGAFGVRIPPKPDDKDRQLQEATPDDVPVMLKVGDAGKITINDIDVRDDAFVHRLRRVLNAREDRIVYMDASDKARYGWVLKTIDSARESGADPVVLVPDNPARATKK